MSDGEAGPSTLGKRARLSDEEAVERRGDANGASKADASVTPVDDDSDDEIGPMPGAPDAPEVVTNGKKKKRRASTSAPASKPAKS